MSLLKPLVARPGRTTEPLLLEPDQEPLLFAFVSELASCGGMPKPSSIAVDWSPNSYCVFAGGLRGAFRAGFVLVIGLSLAADLCLDQLAGALAHEMGHAVQAVAVPSSRILWNVNAWFSRIALEPDAWDERILHRFETAGPWTKFLLRCAQALATPGRAVARFLLMVESAVCSAFLRRIELEADRCQLRVAGMESFISTILETNLLAVASQRAVVHLSRMWRERRLVDDYPGLVVFIRRHYSSEFVQRIQAGLEEGKTGIFSSHPSDKDRIVFARAEGKHGTLPTGLPAAALFTDYGALCREVTLEYYDQDLRLERRGCQLIPIQKLSLF
jgi:hypothetical protein